MAERILRTRTQDSLIEDGKISSELRGHLPRVYRSPLEDYLTGGRGDLKDTVKGMGQTDPEVYEEITTPYLLKEHPDDPEALQRLLEERARHPYLIPLDTPFTTLSLDLDSYNLEIGIRYGSIIGGRANTQWEGFFVNRQGKIIKTNPLLMHYLILRDPDVFGIQDEPEKGRFQLTYRTNLKKS